jgi:CubicO group peptidase (beta-lactamase class C family)
MISRRLLLGLAGAGALAASSFAPALAFSPEARNAKLDETLRGLVEGRSTPGIAVLILQNGKPVYSRNVGVRDPAGNEPIADTDMFRLASMTKAVTSVATMILVEDGKVGLDDPVSRFLPEFSTSRCADPTGPRLPQRARRPSASS